MPTFSEYESFDGLGLANLVQRNVVSPAEVLEAAIERIEERNPSLNAVIFKMYEDARESIKKNIPHGPFQGVPILLKDLLADCAGSPIQMGSRFLQGWKSPRDSEIVKRLKRAGFIILGKTNTPEFGLSPVTEPEAFGATRNPWDVSRTAGGSSGGSAAAVASGMVPIAHATDGGGSLRIPASFCGLFGLKPSRGRTPIGPYFVRVWQGMVVEHALSRSVRDSAAVLDVLSGPELGSPISLPRPDISFLNCLEQPPRKLRIAMVEQPFFPAQIDQEHLNALKKAAIQCESLGHQIEQVVFKIDHEEVAKAFLILIAAETAADLKLLIDAMGRKPKHSELERQTAVVCEVGYHFTAADYAWASQVLDMTARRVAEFFQLYDMMMTPTLAGPPPLVGQFKPDRVEQTMLELLRWMPRRQLLLKFLQRASARNFAFVPFTPLFNISGNPAMTVPLYQDSHHLPIGIQFAGRMGDEATLLQLARQFEMEQPWKQAFGGESRSREKMEMA